MQADLLDARARLRAHARATIAALHALGVHDDEMRGCSLLDLDALHDREVRRLMAAPTGR